MPGDRSGAGSRRARVCRLSGTVEGGAAADPPLFFEYGSRAADASPLALLGGGLILDSGEADESFLFRCQDRFYLYACLLGLRPILLAGGEAHAARYAAPLRRFASDLRMVADSTGLLGDIAALPPLFVGCRLEDGSIFPLESHPPAPGKARFHLNQISPTAARLLTGIDALLGAAGTRADLDPLQCRADGERALRLHDKAQAMAALGLGSAAAQADQLSTAILGPDRFFALRDWEDLAAFYARETGDRGPVDALMVKSSRDSAGNCAALLRGQNFEAARQALGRELALSLGDVPATAALPGIRRDIASSSQLDPAEFPSERLLAFEALRRGRRGGVTLLVQRWIEPPVSAADPPAIGLSFHVGAGAVRTLAVAAQTYHDTERRHFRGALLDRALEERWRGSPFEARLHGLCRRLAADGWRGPVNFDALLAEPGRYCLIQDCNPRLSAVFPALALRRALARTGPAPARLLSLGYRGEYRTADLSATLASLGRDGLLCRADRLAGLLVLPSLVAPDGFDLALIDVSDDEVAPILAALPGYGFETALSPVLFGLPAA